MRIARLAILVLLSLALPSEGGAQYRQRSILADVVETPSAQSTALAEFTRTQAPCRGTLGSAVVGGALLGALVGVVIAFVGGITTTVNSMGHKKFNGTPYIIGGAVLFGFLVGNEWQRRCGMTDGAFP